VLKPKDQICYDFHSRILDYPTHTNLISKPIHTPNLSIVDPIPKQLVESVCILIINLIIPPDIIKQHLPEIFFHRKVGEMIVDETLVQE